MSTLLAIDPGTRKLGWAFFASGLLVRAGLSRVDAVDNLGSLIILHSANLPSAEKGIVELMRVYPGQQQKGDQNDLIHVATIGAGVVSRKCDSVVFKPAREWKGQVPKDVHHARLREKLLGSEKEVALKANHDTMDAIGLGLHLLGR